MTVEGLTPFPAVRVVPKPWGREDWLVVGERIVMKRLVVHAGQRFSLQYHERKEEAWLFVRGRARLTLGKQETVVEPGAVIYVRPGTVHRVEALEEVEFIEVSTPELEDVVRLADDFGRPERDAR
jgi:mannose-1-phosphate guanylyltransferase